MSSPPSERPVALSRRALSALPPGVSAPGYDPAAVSAGIVHLGLGGFHRAHMARYTHELMELDPTALRWGIVGVGLLPADRRIERERADETVRVIGSLAGLIFAGETTTELLAALDDPAVRILSLTVTENGYCLDPATKRLNPSNEFARADCATPEHRPPPPTGTITLARSRAMHWAKLMFAALDAL